MCKLISKLSVLYWTAFAALSCLGSTTLGDHESYLASVGPPPLRYLVSRPSEPVILPPLPVEKEDSTNSTVAIVGDGFDLLRKEIPGLPVKFFLPSTLWWDSFCTPETADSSKNADAGAPTNPLTIPAAASDLLAMTPEMLADYFKPAPLTTNAPPTDADTHTIQAPVGFTPPVPASAGSSATYKTQ